MLRPAHLAALAVLLSSSTVRADTYRSHPPMRDLPTASQRPLGTTPSYFVDPAKGKDDAAGTKDAPWKTIARGVKALQPGDTLVLRGGVYHEHVEMTLQGTAEKPITIRAHPGEIAILDGGYADFLDNPAIAWELVPAGARGEYRSTRKYPMGAEGRRGVLVSGNFADSMVPLHGYRFEADFQTDEMYWKLKGNQDDKVGLWCGPGVWQDSDTERIHVRLAPTNYQLLGPANYRGEADPRKLPLVVAPTRTVFSLSKSRHVIVQDVVMRGSTSATARITDSEHIKLEGVTIYGGSPALVVEATDHLTLHGCVLRGVSAPWSSRASNKYRGLSPYLFVARSGKKQSEHWEFAYCEFTDNHDGLILGTVRDLQFHHNLVDNFDDDGIYLTMQRPRPPENIHIHQNILARSLSLFAFAQFGAAGKNAVGPGVYIYRNIIDLRRGTFGGPPVDARKDTVKDCFRPSRVAGDHGSPTWEPMLFYHNTVLWSEPAFRGYYGMGLAGHTQSSKRRIFNNIFVQSEGDQGLNFGSTDDDIQADYNLLWSTDKTLKVPSNFFDPFRKGKVFLASKNRYEPGWTAHDAYADPKFASPPPFDVISGDWRLAKDSPAINRGRELPREWPDPLRTRDAGAPDVGALPLGAAALRVGPKAAPRD